MHAQDIQPLVNKLKALPPDRVAEVEDFVDFLRSRGPTELTAAKPRVPFNFPVDWIGQWPEDFSLRREEMYGDNGR